jgi:uncharacterized repeat protein (TIGR03803 family)
MTNSKSLTTIGLALACAALTFGLAVRAQAQTLNYFADLDGNNGWEPYASVVQGTDGNFYGAGTNGIGGGGGNLFRMTPSGEITSIYQFCSQPNCADGASVQSAPVLGTDGNLYGVTAVGGNGSCGSGGVFFKLTMDAQITVLYTFAATCTDGATPNGIILASDGNFYGTTLSGGKDYNGTIFKITPSGVYTQLYLFCSKAKCTDGSTPLYPPVEGNDGNFYGTANSGGSTGGGVIYKITPAGQYSVIYNSCNLENGACPNGGYPYAIAKDAAGNFVGTACCGSDGGYGVIFEITPDGKYSLLHTFGPSTGAFGWAGSQMILASDGNLYGTFIGGGSGSWAPRVRGAIYKVTAQGAFAPLYAFCQCGHGTGFNPIDSVFQATDGNFYGTTAFGGTGPDTSEDWGYGTVFQFSNNLKPFVKTVPVAGKAGQSVIILGNNLTGTTSVTFNGVEAAFTVESDTYIKATIPKGATTGTVSVVTSSGRLNSNPQFVVTK